MSLWTYRGQLHLGGSKAPPAGHSKPRMYDSQTPLVQLRHQTEATTLKRAPNQQAQPVTWRVTSARPSPLPAEGLPHQGQAKSSALLSKSRPILHPRQRPNASAAPAPARGPPSPEGATGPTPRAAGAAPAARRRPQQPLPPHLAPSQPRQAPRPPANLPSQPRRAAPFNRPPRPQLLPQTHRSGPRSRAASARPPQGPAAGAQGPPPARKGGEPGEQAPTSLPRHSCTRSRRALRGSRNAMSFRALRNPPHPLSLPLPSHLLAQALSAP